VDVNEWLDHLGLGQYACVFADNDIDINLLSTLTEADLKEIGVASLGHRRKLLSAIAALVPPSKSSSPLPDAQTAGPKLAERRPITVMFCDLVGSTSIAASLDAEDWRDLVGSYLDEADKAVTGFGGHVLKKLGDGIMALFGYPSAQENDAERAARASLAILRALEDLNVKNGVKGLPTLSARIGLESAPVVVDSTGEVFGEAPNIAARVQALAEPGTVLVTSNVQRQVAGLFVAEDKGAHDLKGVRAPAMLYRLVRASGGGRRAGGRTLTRLVGREDDLGLVQKRWERARTGDGQFVLIVGEPGIGKSRLVEEFHSQLGVTPHTWVEWTSSQLLQNTPLHPVAEWGRQRFGADVPENQRLADLENTLRLVGMDPVEYASLLAPLVGIPLAEDQAARFDPGEFRRRQLAAMTSWILAGARTQPVVLAFEDLHWADPSSLDLVRALADRGSHAPLLVIATARPEFRAGWQIRPHHCIVALAPLDRDQTRRMVGEIAGRHALPPDVVDRVGERTGGVPLFIEEVTRLLLERDEKKVEQAIPPTLQQSLAARLDRLGEARDVAQIGAVLGRDFSYGLVREVAGLDEPALQSALERIVEADLLFVEGAPPEPAYRFKHALIRDAAYDSLLKNRRQALHRRAAEALVRRSAQPEPIAHHFSEAGLNDLAIEWWLKAAELALSRSAHSEADRCAGSGLALTERLPTGSERASRQLALLITRANAQRSLKGFNAPETVSTLMAAKALADSGAGTATQHFSVLHGLSSSRHTGAQIKPALEIADEMLDLARRQGDLTFRVIGNRVLGMLQLEIGENHSALQALREAEHYGEHESKRAFGYRFGSDPDLNVLNYKIWALAILGLPREAIRAQTKVLMGLKSQEHSPTIAGCIFWAKVWPNLLWRDFESLERNANELVTYCDEMGAEQFRRLSAIHGAFARAMRNPGRDRAVAVGEAIDSLHQSGARVFDSVHLSELAESYLMADETARAASTLDEAFRFVAQSGERFWLAELHRLDGRIALMGDQPDQDRAEVCFSKAIEVARSQGAMLLALRAATDLARARRGLQPAKEIREALNPILALIEDGEDLRDVREAQAVLEQLTPQQDHA
jgi:class 3 adenylate cyclase